MSREARGPDPFPGPALSTSTEPTTEDTTPTAVGVDSISGVRRVSAYERLIDALRAGGGTVNVSGTGVMAQCPAHEDRKSSLSVKQRHDGRGAVLYCFAGCEWVAVLDALGLAARDLFDGAPEARLDRRVRAVTRRPAKTVNGTVRAHALAGEYGSLSAAGRARAETHHDPHCAYCRAAEPLGGPEWWGRFCVDCAAGWAPADRINEQQRWNAMKQAAVAISQTCDWKQVAQRVRSAK